MKYIKTTLSANFGNFYAIALSSLFINYIPMIPIQILLLNFLSDFPMIVLATDNVDQQQLSRPQKYDVKSILLIAFVLGVVSAVFDFVCFAFFMKKPEGVLQTGWFIESVLTELVFIFSIRTKQWFFRGIRPSFELSLCAVLVGSITVLLSYMQWSRSLFGFSNLSLPSLGFIFSLVLIYFMSTEVIKYIYYQKLYPDSIKH